METTEKEKYLEQISQIRQIMDTNTKFLSLSGLSGVWAGMVAIAGCFITSILFHDNFLLRKTWNYMTPETARAGGHEIIITICAAAMTILIVAVAGGFLFTLMKVHKRGERLWNAVSKKMLAELFAVLTVGGIFCLVQLEQHHYEYVIGSTLLFYGLALFQISKYTVREIKLLSFCIIALGLINTWFTQYGLFFWLIGFGVLHIVYGALMYLKYDRD
ncbi:MAG: hypothetical protein JWN78_1301 [Bacteroidota bacterium]|nr:hypothetical protein [Bacteroidota bacterium]